MKVEVAKDPVERYKELVEAATASRPGLDLDAFEPVIQAHEPDEAARTLAGMVAHRSSLTLAQAEPLIRDAIASADTPATKAAAASGAVRAALSPSVGIELSDPFMLAPKTRLGFAIALCVGLAACITALALVDESKTNVEAAVIALAVLGGLCLLGAIVFVMGYKNVKIKGG